MTSTCLLAVHMNKTPKPTRAGTVILPVEHPPTFPFKSLEPFRRKSSKQYLKCVEPFRRQGSTNYFKSVEPFRQKGSTNTLMFFEPFRRQQGSTSNLKFVNLFGKKVQKLLHLF